jgi:hypothetical protein
MPDMIVGQILQAAAAATVQLLLPPLYTCNKYGIMRLKCIPYSIA